MMQQVNRVLCTNVKKLNDFRRFSSSSFPLSLGYIAGLQSSPTFSSSDTPQLWSTFDESYEILQEVDPNVLWELETELWEENRMKFIHSTKSISVIDYFVQEGGKNAIRSLVFNTRPKLIQSSIEVEYNTSGSCEKILWQKPPPLVGFTSTHLGGLALSMPLWLASNKRMNDKHATQTKLPNVLVLGAGGCTVPSLLAQAGCKVTAIEANEDVRQAALDYFGATEAGIELLSGYGEEYLQNLVHSNSHTKFDILLIDAEDGKSAPPKSMKSGAFWNDVQSKIHSDAVVAINIISDASERMEFQISVSDALPYHNVWRCKVPEVAEVSKRHSLLFATPISPEKNTVLMRVKEILEVSNYVDRPLDWLKEVELSIK